MSLCCGVLFSGTVAGQEPAALDPANYSPPRLPSGKPDLQGLWSNAVVTPLERPADLADKPFLTEEEAREYDGKRVETINRDSRPENAEADILLAYNDFWWDSGNSGVRTLRTSLIIDPPNGKIPELTEAAKQRRRGTARPPSADGPETQGLSTRCIYYGDRGSADAARQLQQPLPARADRRPRADRQRDGARDAHHPARRAAVSAGRDPPMARQLARVTGTAIRWSSRRGTGAPIRRSAARARTCS